ncbi:2-amino-4-hydroxy-6-hydroxymethyldihydropteridine diphosphokinase [Mesonia aestuariivivens]|uniref:2-amino-4-hydroxy-6-hydroxymethyldihydropteridine pyrophosphokinase n=1 Tax=Mesonia aestuariivivens TaxID=2796128 RepID=A0ABS6W3A6_9FLAO|nr:2-amino-4-hydroxy-6-hydroxymethyldihydropteridine diphosphokinase [Mesonia aestuariivivens]MBW2962337.1 2-amino-4-hydroxy-6-hydroxymethyldihydropteridine diphosphokinase [Mesonia aestuariivivens]
MKKPTTAYLALGSNQGNKLEFLQNAINAIFKRIGEVTAVSSIYKTPAFGFVGEEFFNACVKIETRFSVEMALEKLLEIEDILGRKRTQSKVYENRVIDLDILFFDDKIITSEKLVVPHPRMQERKFVLFPLQDIAAEMIHPVLKKTVQQLANETEDVSEIEEVNEVLKLPQFQLKSFNYLAVEGNIGAGKTSLATMISQDFNAKIITERFKDNPFLPKFYKDQSRYAFPLEMSFLADRYQQLLDDISQFDLFNDFVTADYDVYKSLIFAKVTLQEEEYALYKKLFHIMYKDLAKPDLYVYLYQNTDRLLQNIKKRGRSYEQDIPSDYLENINRGYLDFIKTQHHLNVKIIDISELDFVNFREDYLKVLTEING